MSDAAVVADLASAACIVFDWDGTAVADRSADASVVRNRVEALLAQGVHVVVVSGTNLANIDGQLTARPDSHTVKGRLWLCVNRGSQVFEVGPSGARLILQRNASAAENSALDGAARRVVKDLREQGLSCSIVANRLNRRKVDLIPLLQWSNPAKSQLPELVAAVQRRLLRHGISGGLAEIVDLAHHHAAEAGLARPCVTTDAKHVEIGLTDKSDSMEWVIAQMAELGIGAGLILALGDEFGSLGGVTGSDACLRVPSAKRARFVSVGPEPDGVPPGVQHQPGGPAVFEQILANLLDRIAQRRVPAIDEDPEWTLRFEGGDPAMRRVREALLCTAAHGLGTRGAREEDQPGSLPLTVMAGAFDTRDPPALLEAPHWTQLDLAQDCSDDVRVLDLRTGVLWRESRAKDGGPKLRSLRFVSLTRPGLAALRAEAAPALLSAGAALRDADGPPITGAMSRQGLDTRAGQPAVEWHAVQTNSGGIAAAAPRSCR